MTMCEIDEYIGWAIALITGAIAVVVTRWNNKYTDHIASQDDFIWKQQLYILQLEKRVKDHENTRG